MVHVSFFVLVVSTKKLKMFDSNMKNLYTWVLNQCVGAKHVHCTLCELFNVCLRFFKLCKPSSLIHLVTHHYIFSIACSMLKFFRCIVWRGRFFCFAIINLYLHIVPSLIVPLKLLTNLSSNTIFFSFMLAFLWLRIYYGKGNHSMPLHGMCKHIIGWCWILVFKRCLFFKHY